MCTKQDYVNLQRLRLLILQEFVNCTHREILKFYPRSMEFNTPWFCPWDKLKFGTVSFQIINNIDKTVEDYLDPI